MSCSSRSRAPLSTGPGRMVVTESAAVERLLRISRTMPADGSASLAGERPLIDEWSQKSIM